MRPTKDTNESGWTLNWPELALLLWLLLVALAGSATAQSTDPKSPTPLTAGEISGGEIEERASYYFTLQAGPGEVTAALAAKMKQGAKGANVGVELIDANAKSLASALVSGGLDAGKEKIETELFKQLGRLTSAADSLGGGDTRRKTARVNLRTRQPLVLKLTVDKGVESFALNVGGAVEFAPDAPSSDAAQTYQTDQATQSQPPTPPAQTDPTQAVPSPDPNAGEVQPTSGRPAVTLPGKRPALLKVPAKPAAAKVPAKVPAAQSPQTPASKPAVVKVPMKKQP